MADIKLLDCTLRDGGYVNNWQWGFGSARRIIQTLTRAGVDVVEVGFLRNVDGYDPDVTVCNTIEELNRLLPDEGQRGHTMYSGMAMRSNYDIAKLSPYDGRGIEIIRITAHDYDIKDGMDFARRIKELGYKVSINPINIMGYSDKDLLWIFEQVNEIHPWQFSIVDTFGSMRRRDLERIVSMADHNLAPDIRLALHLHENMALSFCLAQEFLDKHLRRDLAVDGSLMGMGRIPGNLPIELIADYMNEYFGGHYNIDDLMDAIQDHIAPIKGNCAWGYTPAYFLSARFNLHRNYAEHYLGKGDLTNRDINHILAAIAPNKKTVFDAAYADTLYTEYKNRRIDDAGALAALQRAFAGKTVLILGTGGTHSTVTAVCRDGGAKEILTASRTGKGDALLYSEAMHRPDVQIIVNTTPCGMFPNVGQCLIDPKAFPALEAVLDVVYNPFRTELLLRAEDCGVTAAGGFEMLVAQAVFAAEHFTGRQLDTAAIIPAVSRELRHQLANVSIIGMPGCGKSTVGAALAKRLDKKFVDLDAEIERRTGHNIPDIFAQEGEAAFRRYETDVLAEVAKGNSQVIACGGGVIKSPANTRALRQNGPVLWVRRPLEALATGGRPLSKGGAALKQLEAERTPLYEAASTAVLENYGTLGEAVDAAVKLFETDEKL